MKHYSHIRMEAKRAALESIVENQSERPDEPAQEYPPVPTVEQQGLMCHELTRARTDESPLA